MSTDVGGRDPAGRLTCTCVIASTSVPRRSWRSCSGTTMRGWRARSSGPRACPAAAEVGRPTGPQSGAGPTGLRSMRGRQATTRPTPVGTCHGRRWRARRQLRSPRSPAPASTSCCAELLQPGRRGRSTPGPAAAAARRRRRHRRRPVPRRRAGTGSSQVACELAGRALRRARGARRRARPSAARVRHPRPDRRASATAIGDLPRGHGLLGRIIDQPEPLRLHDIADAPRVVRLPAEPPADAARSSASRSGSATGSSATST